MYICILFVIFSYLILYNILFIKYYKALIHTYKYNYEIVIYIFRNTKLTFESSGSNKNKKHLHFVRI